MIRQRMSRAKPTQGRNDMGKNMIQGGSPLDAKNIAETLSALEGIRVDDIPFGPMMVAGVMSDAALIIRALLEEAKGE
jgi:hypothetical protein